MNKVSEKLSLILRFALIPLLAIIVIFSFRMSFLAIHNMLVNGYGVWGFIGGITVLVLGIFTIKSKWDEKDKLWIIIGIALVIRIVWIITVPSVPVSDYATMYDSAERVLHGDFSGMHGTGYFARYPHLVLSVMYMAFMKLLFGNDALMAIRVISVFLSIINIFLIHNISKYFVKSENMRLTVALCSALFPPFITYVSTFCTENLAIPFLLLGILYFCKIVKGDASIKNVILCGLFMGISNMFRGVGAIVIIAMGIFLFLQPVKKRIKTLCIIIAYTLAITGLVSTVLLLSGVTEAHIWNGKESGITYFLKGLNVDAKGAWNETDAKFVEEHLLDEDFNEQCIDIIKERLEEKSAYELTVFFFNKFVNQWVYGDCNGTYWAFMNTPIKYHYPIDAYSQMVSCGLLLLSLISLFKRQDGYESFLHILLCGFGLFFLVFESQPRYAYIIYWVFIPLAVQGLQTVINEINKRRTK